MTSPAYGTGLHAVALTSPLGGPFDLSVRAGECVAISGRSGSGKSVLLRMIADLDPHDGEVWLDGAPRSAIAAHAWRRAVGYVPAQSGWWDDTVASHFIRPEEARRLCADLALPPILLDAPVARLSTGERQRLALLRALEVEPKFLLLDEPSSGLDAESTVAVETFLQARLRAGLGIVLVSHDPTQIARMASQHFQLAAGHLSETAA